MCHDGLAGIGAQLQAWCLLARPGAARQQTRWLSLPRGRGRPPWRPPRYRVGERPRNSQRDPEPHSLSWTSRTARPSAGRDSLSTGRGSVATARRRSGSGATAETGPPRWPTLPAAIRMPANVRLSTNRVGLAIASPNRLDSACGIGLGAAATGVDARPAIAFAQTHRRSSAEPPQPRDDRIPRERSSGRVRSRRSLRRRKRLPDRADQRPFPDHRFRSPTSARPRCRAAARHRSSQACVTASGVYVRL